MIKFKLVPCGAEILREGLLRKDKAERLSVITKYGNCREANCFLMHAIFGLFPQKQAKNSFFILSASFLKNKKALTSFNS